MSVNTHKHTHTQTHIHVHVSNSKPDVLTPKLLNPIHFAPEAFFPQHHKPLCSLKVMTTKLGFTTAKVFRVDKTSLLPIFPCPTVLWHSPEP